MKFYEVIDIKHWQSIQDIFSSIISISLRTVNQDGEIIVRPSNMPAICAQVAAESTQARKKCWQWYPQLSSYLKKRKLEKYYKNVCPLGLVNFAVPISFNNVETVYLIIGPLVLETNQSDVFLSQKIQSFGVDESKFFECFNKLPSLGVLKVNNVIDSLNAITLFMAGLEAFELKIDNEKIVFDNEKISGLLRAFLGLAMKLCDAERGSVMMFEKNKQELSIKDAKGLSKDVIDQTKLKAGEGLAGLSIQRRKALYLSEQLSDRELRLRMHKPKIKSAFVIPVFYKNEILGVISVGTVKKPNRFSDQLMELLNELVGMALEKITLE